MVQACSSPDTSEVRKATSGCSYGRKFHIMHFPSCRVWDVNDGSLVNRLDHHSDLVLCLRFNSDTMVTASWVLCILVSIYMTLYWGEPEGAPHRRVCCEFSIYIYRTSCRKSLPARILRVIASCVNSNHKRTHHCNVNDMNDIDTNHERSTSTRMETIARGGVH